MSLTVAIILDEQKYQLLVQQYSPNKVQQISDKSAAKS